MVNENKIIPKELNKKKYETVQEIKDYQVPSYEEFMKNYNGERVNYADLENSDISNSRGYGPGNVPSFPNNVDCGIKDVLENPIRREMNKQLEKATKEALEKSKKEKEKKQSDGKILNSFEGDNVMTDVITDKTKFNPK